MNSQASTHRVPRQTKGESVRCGLICMLVLVGLFTPAVSQVGDECLSNKIRLTTRVQDALTDSVVHRVWVQADSPKVDYYPLVFYASDVSTLDWSITIDCMTRWTTEDLKAFLVDGCKELVRRKKIIEGGGR